VTDPDVFKGRERTTKLKTLRKLRELPGCPIIKGIHDYEK